MALTSEQVSEMLKTMNAQMQAMNFLRTENQELQRENQTLQQGQSTVKREPPKRPTIETNSDDSDWSLFLDSWQRYKKITKLESREDTILELRSACSHDVNKLLFEFIGAATLNDDTLNEETLLRHIRSVAIKGVHKEVHRMNFSKITQSSGEAITHYIARLNAKASLCDFNVDCHCQARVSFAEEMVAQQLVAGLRNQDHQAKILGEATSLTSLSRKIDRLISLETAEEASTTINCAPNKSIASAGKMSGYKKEIRRNIAPEKLRQATSNKMPWMRKT